MLTHSGFQQSARRDSNPRPQPWQGCALPLSYFRLLVYYIIFYQLCADSALKMAELTGLEPATSGVTGRRSNQLSYSSTPMTQCQVS